MHSSTKAVIRKWVWTLVYNWKYQLYDPDICCCGDMIEKGGSICHHGGCRSMREYTVTGLVTKKTTTKDSR